MISSLARQVSHRDGAIGKSAAVLAWVAHSQVRVGFEPSQLAAIVSQQAKSFDLEAARTLEIEGVRSWFKPASKVLEIGGGNGYQATIISSWGCAVLAVDVACPRGETYRKSVLYDGVKLPVREHSIDVVFSSTSSST